MTVLFDTPASAIVATTLREISSSELEIHVPALSELLRDTVNAGAGLGFLPPLTREQGRNYWRSIRAELDAGSRLLLAAFAGGRMIGTGQLVLSVWPDMPHKAELQKILVAAAARGRGVGRSLIAALHDAARQRGRSLLTLSTRRGARAEDLYKSLGYLELGVMPRATVGPQGERYDSVFLYQDLSERGWIDVKSGHADAPEQRAGFIRASGESWQQQADG